MRADETGTLAQLKVLREELVDPIVTAHRGRFVKLIGAGALVEFASVSMLFDARSRFSRVWSSATGICRKIGRSSFASASISGVCPLYGLCRRGSLARQADTT
jgi:class 3 adenylate cyclase